MKIGFFGDSFCTNYTIGHKANVTYLNMLATHYDAEVVNLGVGGSSIWDVLLLQIDPFIKNNNIPDICVFVWTEPNRLFHRVLKNLSTQACISSNNPVLAAAANYYLHLHDYELARVIYVAALHYFDTVILPTFPKNTKIVHLWSFGDVHEWHDENSFLPERLLYHHTWKNGLEIRPSFTSIITGQGILISAMHTRLCLNHIPIGKKFDLINHLIFNLIKDAIDQQ